LSLTEDAVNVRVNQIQEASKLEAAKQESQANVQSTLERIMGYEVQ
jgi:hypothetical protein